MRALPYTRLHMTKRAGCMVALGCRGLFLALGLSAALRAAPEVRTAVNPAPAPKTGVWYTAWWTQDDQFHHWTNCHVFPRRGRYTAGDPAVIAAYLSFFPITVGMVKGFRAPEPLQIDLMRTYSATQGQTFAKLRAPASAPYFFASMQIGAAAALVGAVVAEVTKSEDGGLGARLLAGSYYGQTVQIWAALFAATALSATLVGLIALAGRIVLRRMAFSR